MDDDDRGLARGLPPVIADEDDHSGPVLTPESATPVAAPVATSVAEPEPEPAADASAEAAAPRRRTRAPGSAPRAPRPRKKAGDAEAAAADKASGE